MAPVKVLVVDDDSSFASTLADILALRGYEVITASEGAAALAAILDEADPPLVALVDIGLPDISGLEVARKLRESRSGTQVVILTGDASVESAIGAVRADTVDYLVKPVQPPTLLDTIERASERGLRRLVELELERERKLKSEILDASPVGMAVLTPEGDVTYLNRSAHRILGIEELAEGGAALGLVRAWLAECTPVRDAGGTETSPVGGGERRYVRPDGRAAWLSCNSTLLRTADGTVDGVLEVFWDVTEQRRLEERLNHAHKMEAVGRLAGGVAHDFNNVLTVILAHAELLLSDLPEDSPHADDVAAIREAALQASDVAAQLLTFSRRAPGRAEHVDVNAIIRGMSGLLARTLGDSIRVSHELDASTPKIEAEPGQLRQVLMNLAMNARDAMGTGGVLSFRTLRGAGSNLDGDGGARVRSGREGWVVIEVQDDGVGMDAATRSRIFEPFFTTKGEGQGTGLGLATVYGIVTQLGGDVEVMSELGSGTCFRIRLPAA